MLNASDNYQSIILTNDKIAKMPFHNKSQIFNGSINIIGDRKNIAGRY